MSFKGFSVGDALQTGWRKMTGNLAFLVGFIILFLSIPLIPNFLSQYFAIEYPFGAAALGIIAFILSILMSMGLYRLSLALADNESPKWEYLVSTFNLFFNFLAASILYALIVAAGVLLLVVPGIIWGLRYSFFGFNIIDKGMGPFEALKQSGKQTYGIKWDLFSLGVVTLIINFLGAICFIIGLFVTIPVTWVAWAWVYRKTTSQSHRDETMNG